MKKPYLRWPGGPKTSRFSIGVCLFISIWYFVGFLYAMIQFALHSDLLTPFDVFWAGGILALSLAAAYAAFFQLKSLDLTRNAFSLMWLGLTWGLFSSAMKIYPWNMALTILWLLLGLLGLRRSKWELVEGEFSEKEPT